MKSRRKDAILAAAKMCRSEWQKENRVAAISPTSPEVISTIIQDIEPLILRCVGNKLAPPPVILDAGCGDARWLVEISRYFHHLSGEEGCVKCVGVDINVDSALSYIGEIKDKQSLSETSEGAGLNDCDWLDSIELVMCDMFKNFTLRASHELERYPIQTVFHSGMVELASPPVNVPAGELDASDGVPGVPTGTEVRECELGLPGLTNLSSSVERLRGGNIVRRDGGANGEPIRFEMPIPTILICYLSREGNQLLKSKLIDECKVSADASGKQSELVLVSVGVR